MSVVNISAGSSYTPFAGAALNALATGSYVLDSVGFDNTAGIMTAIDLLLVFATSFTPTAGGTISVYMIPALDGTNYASPGNAASAPPASLLAGVYSCVAAATTVIPISDLPMTSRAKYHILLLNSSGTAFSAVNTTVSTAFPKTISIV